MKIALILTTLLVVALIGLATYMLSIVTSTGLIVVWTVVLIANMGNCWMLGKAYASLYA